MDENAYKAELEKKTVDELTSELQKQVDLVDMLFTMNNSLDDADLSEGGGTPEAQQQYQDALTKQKLVNFEINKRHMLDLIDENKV